MALPNDVTTASVTFGPYTDAEGAVQYEGLVGLIAPSSPVHHIATGAVIVAKPVKVVIEQGGVASVTLPQTGQASLNPPNFTYTLTWQVARFDGSPGNLTFALPVAAGPTVDFDTLAPTPAGVSVPSGVVSVNGHPGIVTLTAADVGADVAGAAAAALSSAQSDADGALAAEVARADGKYLAATGLDAATAANVGTRASATALALDALVAALLADPTSATYAASINHPLYPYGG